MNKLDIVVDENIPYARETFGALGEVRLLHGRKITPEDVKDADALIVRSITKVNDRLLDGSRVRFVGTATIGFDHVDAPYLAANGIAFHSAPGSNANSVSEYIVAALLLASERLGRPLEGATIGVVGVGNVGSRVVRKAEALGMQVLQNDPPKQRETGDAKYLPLQTLLTESDYITLHVPLEKSGPDATVGLAGRSFFEALKPGCVFMNSSRGQVVDEPELKRALSRGGVSLAVLDVWQNEPAIDPDMVEQAFIATPHIAGYSFDGKVVATGTLYEALCAWLGEHPSVNWRSLTPAPPVPRVTIGADWGSGEQALKKLTLSVYDILRDDWAMRETARTGERRGIEFDLLRKNYPIRREFQNTEVQIPPKYATLAGKVSNLGFRLKC